MLERARATSETLKRAVRDRREATEYGTKEQLTYDKIIQVQLEFIKHLHDRDQIPIKSLLGLASLHLARVDIHQFKWSVLNDTSRVPENAPVMLGRRLLNISDSLSPTAWAETAWKVIEKTREDSRPKGIKKLWRETRMFPVNRNPRFGNFVGEISRPELFDENQFDLAVGESCLEVHFPVKAALSSGEKVTNPRSSFQQIALYIKHHAPQVSAVVGESWLMSTLIAERLGFEPVEIVPPRLPGESERRDSFPYGTDGVKVPETSFDKIGYWLQLIDEKGNIKQDVKEYLMVHRRLPYDFARGKIGTVSFLRKFLPPTERGLVTLERPNEESVKRSILIQKEEKMLKEFMLEPWESKNWKTLRAKLPAITEILGERSDDFFQLLKDTTQGGEGSALNESSKWRKRLRSFKDVLDGAAKIRMETYSVII